jgi:hypothetical protein
MCVRQLGGTLNAENMSAAAFKGHLLMCQHLHAEHCPWAEACADAARGGHLETLCWLREKGCPWDSNRVAEEAAAGGRMHILEYLHNERLLNSAEVLTNALNFAGSCKELTGLCYCRQTGWSGVMSCWHGQEQKAALHLLKIMMMTLPNYL